MLTSLFSSSALLCRFGTGPFYYVEMKLSVPAESNVYQDLDNTGNTILLETASLYDMPHSVHLFLEQVSHELYDGTIFYKNADHVLLAGPGAIELARDKFHDHPSLNSVLFQEYSPRMPHVKYTLGYAGRPGGPDFYINLDDNTQIHGPGGQRHYENELLVADADPCFAKIIHGQALVDRLTMATVEADGRETKPIRIETMRIVHGPAMAAVTQEA
jgi:cyclophilin family peptidyl-prolyl cis-trans isomerase